MVVNRLYRKHGSRREQYQHFHLIYGLVMKAQEKQRDVFQPDANMTEANTANLRHCANHMILLCDTGGCCIIHSLSWRKSYRSGHNLCLEELLMLPYRLSVRKSIVEKWLTTGSTEETLSGCKAGGCGENQDTLIIVVGQLLIVPVLLPMRDVR